MKKYTLKSVVSTLTTLVAILGVGVIAYYNLKEVIQGIFIPEQFYLYFTVQTGLLFALMQLLYQHASHKQETVAPWLQWSRFAVTLYALIIAPIYWGVVQPPGSWRIDDWWVVIHLVLPVTALASWWILPKPLAIRWWWPLAALSYPLAFVGVSLMRGLSSGWYPYDFLDHQIGGWEGVWQWVGILTVGIALIGYALWLSGRPRTH